MFKVVSFCYRYEMPQYGSRRHLLPPAGQEEYGEVVGEAEEEYEEEEVITVISLCNVNIQKIIFLALFKKQATTFQKSEILFT